MRARSSTDVPFERSDTASPSRSRAGRRRRPRARPRPPGRWNWSSGIRSISGPGEERPVAQEAELPTKCSRHGSGERRQGVGGGPAPRTAREAGAEHARRPRPAVIRRRSRPESSVEHGLGVRREADVEACGELREPGELVGDGRDHRTAQALHAAFEVHRGSLALERPGRREDQVGPAGGERRGRVTRSHVGPLGERTHARVGRRIVAGDDEEPDRPLARPRLRPPRRPTPRRRRARWAWRGGGMPRSRASLRSRGRARPLRASHRLHHLGPTRSGRRGPTRAGACRARSPSARSQPVGGLARRRGPARGRRS